MPVTYLKIEWPDNKPDKIYSPSSTILNYFKAGDILAIEEFRHQIKEALTKASKRVLERYGFECTSAMSELERVNEIINKIQDKTLKVKITSIE